MRHALIALLLLLPAAAGASSYFGAIDVYDPVSFGQGLGSDYRKAIESIEASGATGRISRTLTPGVGVRAGVFAPTVSSWEVAGSAGLVLGPMQTTTIKVPGGRAEIESFVSYFRVMLEAGKRFRVGKAFVKLGGGAGLAFGRVSQDTNVSGAAVGIVEEVGADQDVYGISAEISPSVIVPIKKVELEFGVRYAQFPARGTDPRISDFDWRPLSVFAAVRY